MIESHLQHSGCNPTDDPKPGGQERLDACLENAIRAVDLSWTTLSEAARDFDIDVDKPEPEDATRRGYFETMKWDALELADGIYWSASEVVRAKDDEDLERFESTGRIEDEFSARIRALALLTFAKELIEPQYTRR